MRSRTAQLYEDLLRTLPASLEVSIDMPVKIVFKGDLHRYT